MQIRTEVNEMNKGDGKREKKKAKTYDGEGEKGQKDDKGVQK
jgi:hypothetical protein